MKKLTRKYCIICLSLLIIFLLAGSGLQGAVLCYDEGGHFTVGAADSNCCSNCSSKISDGPSQVRSADSTETETSSKHDCGACVVIPLSIGFAAVAKESNHVDPTLPASGIIAFAAVDSADSTEYRSVSEPFVPPPYFTPLQSIVLLL